MRAIVARVHVPPQAAPQFYIAYDATDRKRKIAKQKNSPPILATNGTAKLDGGAAFLRA